MIGRLATSALALLALTACAAVAQPSPPPQKVADAQPGQARMIVSNGLRVPLQAVRDPLTAKLGAPMVIQYGASKALQADIEADQAFEVTILTAEVVDEMIAKGKVRPGSRADLARVKVAVAQRGEHAPVDVSSVAAVKTALLGAKVVRFAPIGASRPTVDNTFAKLGVTEALKDRTGPLPNATTPNTATAPGEYELIINLASEFVGAPGETYLGPLPESVQVPVIMSAGVGVKGDAAKAAQIIAYLKSPVLEPALKASRMTR